MKKFKKNILIYIIPIISFFIVKILYFTYKKRYHLPSKDFNINDKQVIISIWHNELLLQPLLYNHIKQNPKVSCMVSEHFDGEILTKFLKYFKFETIRGSSSKGGAKVLISAIKKIREGYDVAITPDGPRGPIFEIKNGIIAIAQKTNKDIVTFRYKSSNYWQLKSWDKFIIPKPFSTIDFYVSERFNLADLNMKSAKNILNKKMKII
jgi:lysophospholipid acyltransferase (LPLAT)-like uncharacterized protein